MPTTKQTAEKLEEIKTLVRRVVIGVSAITLGVLILVVLTRWQATDQNNKTKQIVADQAASTQRARIGSCNQYNRDQLTAIQSDINQAQNLIAISHTSPDDPRAAAYLRGAEVQSRMDNRLRDCSPEGIKQYLNTSLTIDCAYGGDGKGFCKPNPNGEANFTVASTTTTAKPKSKAPPHRRSTTTGRSTTTTVRSRSTTTQPRSTTTAPCPTVTVPSNGTCVTAPSP